MYDECDTTLWVPTLAFISIKTNRPSFPFTRPPSSLIISNLNYMFSCEISKSFHFLMQHLREIFNKTLYPNVQCLLQNSISAPSLMGMQQWHPKRYCVLHSDIVEKWHTDEKIWTCIECIKSYRIIFMALYAFNFTATITCLSSPSFHKGLPELCKTHIPASCCKRNFFISEQSVVCSQVFKYLLHCSFS